MNYTYKYRRGKPLNLWFCQAVLTISIQLINIHNLLMPNPNLLLLFIKGSLNNQIPVYTNYCILTQCWVTICTKNHSWYCQIERNLTLLCLELRLTDSWKLRNRKIVPPVLLWGVKMIIIIMKLSQFIETLRIEEAKRTVQV